MDSSEWEIKAKFEFQPSSLHSHMCKNTLVKVMNQSCHLVKLTKYVICCFLLSLLPSVLLVSDFPSLSSSLCPRNISQLFLMLSIIFLFISIFLKTLHINFLRMLRVLWTEHVSNDNVNNHHHHLFLWMSFYCPLFLFCFFFFNFSNYLAVYIKKKKNVQDGDSGTILKWFSITLTFVSGWYFGTGIKKFSLPKIWPKSKIILSLISMRTFQHIVLCVLYRVWQKCLSHLPRRNASRIMLRH